MANEVLALPDTLRSARELVADLAKLADHLAAVGDQLEHQMENLLGPMAQTVKQVNSIEASVTELRNTLFGILKRVPGARKSLIDLASPGGRVCLLGIAVAEVTVIPVFWITREITVTGSINSRREDFDEALRLLAEQPDVAGIVTRRVGLDEVPATFRELLHPSDVGKVVIEPAR